MRSVIPNYLKTYRDGRLEAKIERLNEVLFCCSLCPRNCKVNRNKGERGFCGAGRELRISSAFAHFGEETCLVGKFGSGTIFFSHCNLKCVFCQNFEISHRATGRIITEEQLSIYMLYLQGIGCHNINLVTPTHFIPQILRGLYIAVKQGLNIPLVYNCGGYESEEIIDVLNGVVDIYMPDVKFSSSEVSQIFCGIDDYFPNLKRILKKMHQQVGDLEIIEGIAYKGLLVRHLVLPHGLAGTKEIMNFITQDISAHTYVNIMNQYRPCGLAHKFAQIDRNITQDEYIEALRIAHEAGLSRLD